MSETNNKLAELSRFKDQFDSAMKRYDEKLKKKNLVLRQKPFEKRKRILLAFDNIDKQLRNEFTNGLLNDVSEDVKNYYRHAMPKEVDFIMYTPPDVYSETEWDMDVERSYAPLDAFTWETLQKHVKIRSRTVPYGRSRTVEESDFQRLFLVEKNKKRFVPEPDVDLMYEVEKITPPTQEMSSFKNPVRIAWGPGSWFDIDPSCDLMRHTGLTLSTRKQIEQRIDEQYEIEKAAYIASREKDGLKVELNKVSDTLTKYALGSVIRQLTREQAGKDICDAFDAYQVNGANLEDLPSAEYDDLMDFPGTQQYKIGVYESIEESWTNKIKNWKDDGKNIRLPDDIIGSFTIDRTTVTEVRTSGEYYDGVSPTHMRLHHFYLEGVEYRGKITLVPFFVVSLYKKRDNNFYRLDIRNRVHRTFIINEQDKYASLDLKVTKKFSKEDYKGYKHSLCLNLEEFSQLILKPSSSGKRRITRKVPFPLLHKYHMILHGIKKDTVERTLIENKKASVKTRFSEPVIAGTPSDDPNKPFKGIIRSGHPVSDVCELDINGEPHIIVVAEKKYIINQNSKSNIAENDHFSLYLLNRILV